MQTSKWGPHGWKYLHTIAHNYNPKVHSRQAYREFFRLQGEVIPCKYCRDSYRQFFADLPIDDYLDCQKDLTYWLYLLHNKVNQKLRLQGLLDKPDPSYISVYNRYDKWRANCKSKKGQSQTYTCRMPDQRDRCKSRTKRGRQCSRRQTAKGRCSQHCHH